MQSDNLLPGIYKIQIHQQRFAWKKYLILYVIPLLSTNTMTPPEAHLAVIIKLINIVLTCNLKVCMVSETYNSCIIVSLCLLANRGAVSHGNLL